MAHVRAQIRAAAAAVLTGLATTGDRVLIGRTRVLDKDHRPTLLLYTRKEPARPLSIGHPITYLRTVSLEIEGRVQASEPPDETLDQIAAEIETAIGADSRFGMLAKNSVLVATVSDVEAAGDRHEGAIRLTYDVTYSTREGAPETAA